MYLHYFALQSYNKNRTYANFCAFFYELFHKDAGRRNHSALNVAYRIALNQHRYR